ncbi:MAG: hypothetical protein Q8936_10730 [Bacillota bacterium]|nr:hypothetical protein [Bacillota bacterium]
MAGMKGNKNIFKGLGVTGAGIGLALSKFLSRYYGINARIIISGIAMVIVLLSIIVIALHKYYLAAAGIFLMAAPLFVAWYGMYLDNAIIVGVSLAAFFIISIIGAIAGRRIKKNKS